MTNRVNKLFESKNKILTVFFTAGYPELNDTMPILEALQDSGVDMVEVGIPFSDPIADGPTIQQSSERALKNGMHVKLLFEQLKDMRSTIRIPVLMMSSLNPLLQFGFGEFCTSCQEVGVDGLILPDLPMQEYLKEYAPYFKSSGLINVPLITPSTNPARVKTIDQQTEGFIYMVSSSSTTGKSDGISTEQLEYFKRIKNMELKSPVLTGFGISDKTSFDRVCEYSSGGIIGSAFIKALKGDDVREEAIEFVESIKK